MVQPSKAQQAGIKILPAGPAYRPNDVRQRRDMIKNFLAVPGLIDMCCEKLFKVMVTDGQQGFTSDDARRFVLEFLMREILQDRDEEVKQNNQVKKRPAGVDPDKDENFWKTQVEEAIKSSGLKANKNNRDVLKTYMIAVLNVIKAQCEAAMASSNEL